MKRHPVLAALSRDHHKALITAQFIKKGAPPFRGMPLSPDGKQEYVLRFYNEHLMHHFEQEEAILFITVNKMKPDMRELIDELILEHRSMEILIQRIQYNEDIESNLDGLGKLMESHIRKEERILFQQMQEKLSAGEFAEIEKQLSVYNNE